MYYYGDMGHPLMPVQPSLYEQIMSLQVSKISIAYRRSYP